MEQHLSAVLQPIVDGVTGQVVAHEALLRSGSTLPEQLFLEADRRRQRPLLESQARIVALERLKDLPPNHRLFVNIDAVDLSVPFPAAGSEIEAGRVVLELSEAHPILTNHALLTQIRRWKDRGFLLGLDHFGTGYMSAGVLLATKPQIIKLGRPLIENISADAARQKVVQALVDLAPRLGITIIALGVETADEFWAVRDLGIRYIQGYLLAYPGPDPLQHVSLPLRRQAPVVTPPKGPAFL